MARSKIEWLARPGTIPETWNPIIGCSPVSEGCAQCYAARFAHRLAHNRRTAQKYEGLVRHIWNRSVWVNGQWVGPFEWTGTVRFLQEELPRPLRWRRPRTVFVCSMGDLFHQNVRERWIDRILEVICTCKQHTFIALTKRAHLLERKLYEPSADALCRELGGGDYLPNLWIGVTAENQHRANERIAKLLTIPAAVRFVSVEPMLGPIDLKPLMVRRWREITERSGGMISVHRRWVTVSPLDWVICGGETGPGARFVGDPRWVRWARDLRDQCKAAGVPFFFKQMPGRRPIPHDLMVREWPEA